MQRLWRSIAAGLVTAALGLALVLTPLGDTFERTYGLDRLFKWRSSRPPPPGVAVVEINNDTGPELSRNGLLICPEPSKQQDCRILTEPREWPTRTVYARLIDRLVEQNAQGIVLDLRFDHPKPGDADLALAIKQSRRVILFDWLEGGQEPVTTKGGGNGGSVFVEQLQPPTDDVARDAKAIAPFVLAKLGRAAFQFWAFKSSAGDAPTLPAVALQLKALAAYEDWLAVLKEACTSGMDRLPAHACSSGMDRLPARAEEVKTPADMLQLMLTLRRMFQQDVSLRQEIVPAIDRVFRARSDVTARQLITSLAALYAGPDVYFINFYGPPGTIPPITFQSFLKKDAGSGDLSNTMVFVGRSDRTRFQVGVPGEDTFDTSFTKDGIDLSGVEIMATAYANLLSGRTLMPSPVKISELAVVAFGLLAGFLAYFLPPTAAVPAMFALTAFYTGLLQWRFNEADSMAAAGDASTRAVADRAADRTDGPISAEAPQRGADDQSHPLLPAGEPGQRSGAEAGRPNDIEPGRLRNVPRPPTCRISLRSQSLSPRTSSRCS